MDQVAQIREKIDIVALISEFIPVKKAGRNFKANCPFHQEKSPSFVISPERQIWHCFGCGKGGDCYSFLMEYERLEFPEALRMLAARAGVTLETSYKDSGVSSKKERMYQVNSLAKEFYHYILTKHKAGKNALKYLEERGITDKMIETFTLGFAPATGSALVRYLLDKKKYTRDDVLDGGLAFLRGVQLTDFFRGRLIFPLIDHRDNVVGFSGRIMTSDNPQAPKYINTKETLVYHKGDHFYGLNITKEAVKRENQVIIVEGEFDVISCFENGVSHVVGVKGTALTESQVNLLSRYASKITFCFDGDRAGQEAIKRSLSVVEKKGLTPTVIVIPGGKDPDESLKHDAGEFKKAVKNDVGIYDFLLDKAFSENDVESVEGKKKASDMLLPIIANIKNEIVKEHYVRKIASKLDTSHESVARQMQRMVVRETVSTPKPVAKAKRPKDEVLEEYLLSLIIQSDKPRLCLDKALSILSDSMSKERAYQKIMNHLFDHFGEGHAFDSKTFADALPHELVSSYDTSLLFPLPVFENEDLLLTEVEKIARSLRMLYVQQKMKRLALEIKEKEEAGQEDAVELLRKDYSSLTSMLDTS